MIRAQPRRSSRRSLGEQWSKRPRTSLLTKLQVEPARQSSSRLGKPGPWGTPPRPQGLGSQIRFSSRSTCESGGGTGCRRVAKWQRGRRQSIDTCNRGQPFCRASTGSCRGVLLQFMPVLTSRTWSWGQQLPCNGGGTHQVKGLAVPAQLCPCPFTNLPAAHPRWLSSGNCRSATASAFGTLLPPRSSPQL